MKNGQFTADGPFRYASLWDGIQLAAAPCLGPTSLQIFDFSGKSNAGLITGTTAASAWKTDSTGIWSYSSNGTSDYADFGTIAGIVNPTALTFSVWFYKTSASSTYNYCGFDNTVGNQIGVALSLGTLYIAAQGGSTFYCTLTDGSVGWNHYLFTFIPGLVNTFVNGQSVTTSLIGTAPTALSPSGNLTIGKYTPTAGFNSLDALTDDLRIYSRVLNADEIFLLSRSRGIAYTPAFDLSF